jgi:hypothetical protein
MTPFRQGPRTAQAGTRLRFAARRSGANATGSAQLGEWPRGQVSAAIGTARNIGLDTIVGPDGKRCRDLVLSMLVGRILDTAGRPFSLGLGA